MGCPLPEQPDEVAMTDQTSPRPDGPTGTPRPPRLQDLRVTELGQLLAGPFCGQLLGDFGAEVIKVEDPGQGDPMRQWGREKPHGMSLWWPVVARNKKSVTANLRDPAARTWSAASPNGPTCCWRTSGRARWSAGAWPRSGSGRSTPAWSSPG